MTLNKSVNCSVPQLTHLSYGVNILAVVLLVGGEIMQAVNLGRMGQCNQLRRNKAQNELRDGMRCERSPGPWKGDPPEMVYQTGPQGRS